MCFFKVVVKFLLKIIPLSTLDVTVAPVLFRLYGERFLEREREKEVEERRRFPLEKRLKQFIVGQVLSVQKVLTQFM